MATCRHRTALSQQAHSVHSGVAASGKAYIKVECVSGRRKHIRLQLLLPHLCLQPLARHAQLITKGKRGRKRTIIGKGGAGRQTTPSGVLCMLQILMGTAVNANVRSIFVSAWLVHFLVGLWLTRVFLSREPALLRACVPGARIDLHQRRLLLLLVCVHLSDVPH